MSNLLYITNIGGAKFSVNFCGTSMNAAKELDINYSVVANRNKSNSKQIKSDEEKYGIKLFHADIARSPLSFSNIKAYRQIVKIIKDENVDYIHCNTPVGGVLGRLAGRKCKVKRVIYQAHGFHFYKGAPIKNWLLYYSVESIMAHFSDAIITINKEDYERAKTFKLRNNGKIYFVPGVGVDVNRYPHDFNKRQSKRKMMNVADEDVVLISMGDLIHRKNYETAILAIAKCNNIRIKYWICGTGPEEQRLRSLIDANDLQDQVFLCGYRTDVDELLNAADVFLFTSYQEGLPRSTTEAMAAGLPCIVSKIRGNTDLIENDKGGFLCNPHSSESFSEAINALTYDSDLRMKMGNTNLIEIQKYSNEKISDLLQHIYKEEFLGK